MVATIDPPEYNFFLSSWLERVKTDADWTWDTCEVSTITMTEDKLGLVRSDDSPEDYLSVVGSKALEPGVHCWTIRVESAGTVWLGIARGVKEQGGLAAAPGSKCEYILAFCSSGGDPTSVGKRPSLDTESRSSFTAGEVVEFELDSVDESLCMRINGKQAAHAKNVDVNGVLPFVCMGQGGAVTLIAKTHVRSCSPTVSRSISSDERRCGLDNACWSDEDDAVLRQLLVSGLCVDFC
jgi:hypothetical protein